MSEVVPISIVHMWYRVHVESTHIFNVEKYNSTFVRISLAQGKKNVPNRNTIVTCGDKTIQGQTPLMLFPLSTQLLHWN